MARILLIAGFLMLIAGLAIQALPDGDHTSPPVLAEPRWNAPLTRALAVRACFDCHSNETVWPWYARIAPISWLVERDVRDGRRALNFSEWTRPQKEGSGVRMSSAGRPWSARAGPMVQVQAREFARAFILLRHRFPGALLYGRRIRWQSPTPEPDAEEAMRMMAAAGIAARVGREPLSMEDIFVSVIRQAGLEHG